MKLSHLNGLRALEATLRKGTFTAAADELGVTVAAIGQQIRGLEEYIGVKLFDRLPSGAKPTDEAQSIASRLTVGFTHIEEVLGELRSGRHDGSVSISMSRYVLDDWLAERMPLFHKKFPEVKVNFHTGEKFVDLLSSEADMAIRFSPEPAPEYSFDELYKGCFLPVCTPEFAILHNLSQTTKDLTGVPLFQIHEVTSDPAWIGWPELMKRHGVCKSDPMPIQQISGYRTALTGEGLILCGLTEGFNDLSEGRLVAPLGPDYVMQFTYGYRLVWPAGRSPTRAMRLFRTWLLDVHKEFIDEASVLLGVQLH